MCKIIFEVLIGWCVCGYMECVASHFAGGDVCGYFVNNFSKVEDDVVYYNGADQKKNKAILSFSLFLTLF